MKNRFVLALAISVLGASLAACGSGSSGALQSLPKAPPPAPEVLPPAVSASSVARNAEAPFVRVNRDGSVVRVYRALRLTTFTPGNR